ncbi:hypothetical protein L211DRAFT_310427 [Terfezia boudieri ATCC MYA-4762]|uniref:Uncharacterized protein n=1 Tax=Terfezia boudieri ATCC MYA-4762 TaxID=1051890 RepID=A0A3N4LJ18_9PEZI|nr:hypothetical protein L211DRAFT_310427 [Terfezia boudieri ATCC MYA-4762]
MHNQTRKRSSIHHELSLIDCLLACDCRLPSCCLLFLIGTIAQQLRKDLGHLTEMYMWASSQSATFLPSQHLKG